MIKTELLFQLETAKNNFILVLASMSLFSNSKTYPILDELNCKFGNYSIEFKQVANMMKKENDKNVVCKEYFKMGLRILIKEAFELIKNYSKETKQEQIFTSQSWYQFARCIRNCLSHDCKFQLYDKGKPSYKLPICWKNKTIDISFNNTELQLSFFGSTGAWELFCEFHSFVENDLN